MLSTIFGALWARVFAAIAAIALAFAAVQTVRIEGFLWWQGFKEIVAKLTKENGLLRIDLDQIKLAQEEATERAIAEKKAAEARAEKERKLSDERLEAARKDARARADAYARANRVRAQTVASGSGSTDLSCAPNATEGPDGPCDDAELLTLTRQDFDIMVDNSVRLKEAHEWAKGLPRK